MIFFSIFWVFVTVADLLAFGLLYLLLLPIASFDTHVLASFGWKNGDFDGLVWLLKMLMRKSHVQALFGCVKMVIGDFETHEIFVLLLLFGQ